MNKLHHRFQNNISLTTTTYTQSRKGRMEKTRWRMGDEKYQKKKEIWSIRRQVSKQDFSLCVVITTIDWHSLSFSRVKMKRNLITSATLSDCQSEAGREEKKDWKQQKDGGALSRQYELTKEQRLFFTVGTDGHWEHLLKKTQLPKSMQSQKDCSLTHPSLLCCVSP